MGPNYSISTACATANYAFVSAANHIRNGEAWLVHLLCILFCICCTASYVYVCLLPTTSTTVRPDLCVACCFAFVPPPTTCVCKFAANHTRNGARFAYMHVTSRCISAVGWMLVVH